MSKRIRNYRSGDRAEDLGIFLMKAFCAVAPIPRQEDFGLADAVATLLRPEGKFWYAEDSFLVQFKSRTERKVELQGPLFKRWLSQDLSVLVGRVNLIESTLELYTLGASLYDRRVHDAEGLVVWMIEGEDGLRDGILHRKLGKPILCWSAMDTENTAFIERTYTVLKEWLNLERWNRRYFRAGVAREIRWETNQMPVVGEVVHTWTPAHGLAAVEDIKPLVQLLGLHVQNHPELWTKAHAIEDLLRGPNDPGLLAGSRHFQRLTDPLRRLDELLKNHPTADAVVTVQILNLGVDRASFWIYLHGRSGGSGHRYDETWEELKQKGFDHKIEGDGANARVTLCLDRYVASFPVPHEIFDGPSETPSVAPGDHSPCFFLRSVTSSSSASPVAEQ